MVKVDCSGAWYREFDPSSSHYTFDFGTTVKRCKWNVRLKFDLWAWVPFIQRWERKDTVQHECEWSGFCQNK